MANCWADYPWAAGCFQGNTAILSGRPFFRSHNTKQCERKSPQSEFNGNVMHSSVICPAYRGSLLPTPWSFLPDGLAYQ